MDASKNLSTAAIGVDMPGLKPVAVTRWSARLADPQCERDYRQHRFAEDRRRAVLLVAFVAAAGALNLLGELYAVTHGVRAAGALVPPLLSSLIPLLGLPVFSRVHSPYTLEALLVVGA